MQNAVSNDFSNEVATGTDWFAVYTRHQNERKVASLLAGQEFETFCPTYSELHRWKDRQKEIALPLFPGYVFFRGSLERQVQVLSVPGVHFIVCTGRAPAAIRDEEIDGLRRAVQHTLPLEPFPFLNKGERVRVIHGPLAGVEGLLARKKDKFRLVLSIEILGRSAAVEVDAFNVRPCNRAWGQNDPSFQELLRVRQMEIPEFR
jgi:transcription termination/antitermination protein NusG